MKITDKMRLDFFERYPVDLVCFYNGWAVGATMGGLLANNHSESVGPKASPRKAIDAAIRAEQRMLKKS